MIKHYPASPELPQNFSTDFYLEDEASIEAVHSSELDYSYLTCENLMIRRSILEKITMQRTKLVRFEASNVLFKNCDFSNLEWIGGSFHQVAFENCQLKDSEFFELTWKHLFLVNNELTNSNWQRTRLASLDFTTNQFSKIAFSMEQLNGLKVDSYQALVIAAGLGLQIQDEK